ncbi:hypothetical protein PPACK8108_LOCUS198 [Phakopsora pachyrhizi]|uniref:Uncharacterized protein n=1 Tax=Phakopsora pachyrhizi TaxID=170000 RepID=A0AAV0AFN5_PHAPC|nr:hypothetical protein PPACK8108_LOCUS198 [Phakopsora pachyrhizi]
MEKNWTSKIHQEIDLNPKKSCDISYLNIEQRRNYLVKINEEGKLIWVKDVGPVDTARGKHKDLGNCLGIVDAAEEDFEEARKTGEIPSSDLDLYSTHSSYEADPRHYSVQKPSKSKLAAKIKSCIHPKHMMDHLLRKPLSVNTWIFVADKNGNLYIGIKHPGKFQHSSFLAGSHVLAAGLLKVREALEKYGTLTKKKHELEDKIKNLLSISKPSKGEDLDGEKSKDQKRESKAEGRRTEELIRLERTRLKEEYQKNSRINKIAEQSGDEERKRILKSIRLDSGGDDDEEGRR